MRSKSFKTVAGDETRSSSTTSCKKTLSWRGPNPIYEHSFTVWTVFWGARGSQKATKMRSKNIQNGGVGSQKALRGPLQKSVEIWIDFWRLLGLQRDPGGGDKFERVPQGGPKWTWEASAKHAKVVFWPEAVTYPRTCVQGVPPPRTKKEAFLMDFGSFLKKIVKKRRAFCLVF